MKRFLVFVINFMLVSGVYSQQIVNDTIHETSIKGNFAIRIDYGAHAQHMLKQDLFGMSFSQFMSYSVYYKSFYFTYGIYTVTMKSSKVDFYPNYMDISLGYNFDLNKNWSSDLEVGISNNYERGYRENQYSTYEPSNLPGVIVGIGLNRYFKLKRFNYLVLRLGTDYYSTNYSSIIPELGKGAMNYSLTFAYKGWFRKRINSK